MVLESVYAPAEDSYLLLEEALRRVKPEEGVVVEVGSGTGIVAVCLASSLCTEVVAVDVLPQAALNTLINATRAGVRHLVHVVQGDLISSLRRGACGTVLFNTPYLPVEEREEPEGWAWSGGKTGVEEALRLVEQAGGAGCRRLLLVSSSLADLDSLRRGLERAGFAHRVVSSKHFFFEDIVLLEAERLEAQGGPSRA